MGDGPGVAAVAGFIVALVVLVVYVRRRALRYPDLRPLRVLPAFLASRADRAWSDLLVFFRIGARTGGGAAPRRVKTWLDLCAGSDRWAARSALILRTYLALVFTPLPAVLAGAAVGGLFGDDEGAAAVIVGYGIVLFVAWWVGLLIVYPLMAWGLWRAVRSGWTLWMDAAEARWRVYDYQRRSGRSSRAGLGGGAGRREVPEGVAFDPVAASLAVLQVPAGATAGQVRSAYLRAVAEHHPDRHGQADAREQAVAEERTKAVTAAYQLLREAGRAP